VLARQALYRLSHASSPNLKALKHNLNSLTLYLSPPSPGHTGLEHTTECWDYKCTPLSLASFPTLGWVAATHKVTTAMLICDCGKEVCLRHDAITSSVRRKETESDQ
jgi:hypothetical protein